MTVDFQKNPRQEEALDVLNRHRHGLLYGGSRSGKSVVIARNVFLRAMSKPSKHLVVRFRYNHARTHLAGETIPFVLSRCFPGAPAPRENKSDGYWTVPVVGGGESTVWLGGTDDRDRIEKLLGSEYSTIWINECSQVPFDAVPLLWTRLAENSGLPQRVYYDLNPPGKRHWTNLLFHEGTFPDGSPWEADRASLRLNPADNAENLSPEYLETLRSLPKRQRQRFLEGLYLADVEGALWTDEMIVRARLKGDGGSGGGGGTPPVLRRTVIAVDPSVTNNPGSDECGIVVCSLDEDGDGVVHRDESGKLSTRAWAQRVVDLYHAHGANRVVAEVNQGGDLVEDAIRNVDPNVKVVKVRAAVGKGARAEPVAMLYEQGRVAHLCDMPKLEAELTETAFDENLRASPNRLDALVWGLTYLMVKKGRVRVNVGCVG